ncbi:MAG TPA: mandelate racemase/muconate lactonizing enzyme family protein [Dehalococcoidales bacterium]|nr:mandelate racemase/muconate lactonizing enzyme family protein [Dehalococcoidales bacterium]
MKITKIECFPVSLEFAKPVVMSGGAEAVSNVVVVKIHTNEGVTGVSESGGTSMWYMGESQDSIMYNINKVFGDILLGEDPFKIQEIVARMDKAAKANNQSKAVIDYALHDIMGKSLGVPVYKLLGGLVNEKIQLAFVMSSGSPEEVAAEGKALVKAGFKGLKLKVGARPPDEDIEIVGALRAAVGNKAKVMIDANGGWLYHQALYVLQRVAKYDIYVAEQPVPWWDIEGLARLRRKVDVPIFPDESACELNDLIKIIKADAADGFFLKIPKAGGILKAQRWVTVAQAANLPVMCGCMVNSGLGAAAEAHFLAAMEWMGKIEQEAIGPLNLYNIPDTVSTPLKNDLAIKVPRYEKGFLYPPTGPGLGVALNEKALKQLATPGRSATAIGK